MAKHNRAEFFLYAHSLTYDPVKIRDIERRANETDAGVCWTCFNEGTVEELRCTKAASVCCGGCVKDVPCPDCG